MNESMMDLFKRATKKINRPIPQSELEFLLIESGLDKALKPIEIKKLMNECGFSKKLMMIKGERARYWVSDLLKESLMAQKIRLSKFLKEYLSDKTEIEFNHLIEVMKENKFNHEAWDMTFFYPDETFRKWNGWVLTGKHRQYIYKNVDIKHAEPPQNDF